MSENIVKDILENVAVDGKAFNFTATCNGYILIIAKSGFDIDKAVKCIRKNRGIDVWWSEFQKIIKAIGENKIQNLAELKIKNLNKDAYSVVILSQTQEDLQSEFKEILASEALSRLGNKEVLTIIQNGKITYKSRPQTLNHEQMQ